MNSERSNSSLMARLLSAFSTLLTLSYPFLIYFGWRHWRSTSFLGHGALPLYWPCIVSAGLLWTFGRTLVRPPPLVERFARLQKPALSAEEIVYCRHVTQVWCLFFIFNGSAALALTLYGSIKWWAFYNGFISYLLVGALFAAEYLYRHWRFRPDDAWLSNWMDRWTR